jgi:hypothetical protein
MHMEQTCHVHSGIFCVNCLFVYVLVSAVQYIDTKKRYTSVYVLMYTVSNDTELGEALRAMGHKLSDAEVLKMMKVWQ